MKLPLTVLFLAGSAFACGFALFFNFFVARQFSLPRPLDLHSASLLIGFHLPEIRLPDPLSLDSKKEAPAAAPAPKRVVDVQALIRAAALKHRVPAAFVKSIAKVESNFDCDAVSPKGAIGLMQLMPDTAREYGAEDPTVPEQNVEAGTRYLRFLMSRYSKKSNSLTRVIAAYNAGPGAVDRYHGIPPFRETRGYVVRVLSFMRRFRKEERG